MKVFISWSGDKSKQLAQVLTGWFKEALHSIEPFFSPDIPKGKKWFETITNELKDSKYGLICLTKDNYRKPWILFEAGVLSTTEVCPILFDLDNSDLQSNPLSSFQSTKFSKDDFKILFETLNKNSEKPIDDRTLDKVFENNWPRLLERVNEIISVDLSSETEIIEDRHSYLLNEIITKLDLLTEIPKNRQSSKSRQLSILIDSLINHFNELKSKSIFVNHEVVSQISLSIDFLIMDIADEFKKPLLEKYKVLINEFENKTR